jgi:hypothetical protein
MSLLPTLSPMRRSWVANMLVGLIVAGVGVGCAQADEELLPGDQANAQELRRLATSLVPAGATVAAENDGACEMFRDFPDCRTVRFYDLSGVSREARVEAFVQRAEQVGWLVEIDHVGEGGTGLRLSRDGYSASASIKDHIGYWQTYCEPMGVRERDFIEDCTDTLQVQRERS